MKNKTTAAVLAFFLGAIGGHRFYLGQVGRGIAYFLFSWTFIPAFIAFIDFIIFLTMSEDSFNMKYNRNYMHQFQQQPTVVINNTNHGNAAVPTSNLERERDTPIRKNRSQKIDPFEIAGDEKYEDYDFDGAIYDYQKSLNVRSNNPKVHFKLACLYSLLEQTENSFFHINKAVERGFNDMEEIREHDHLAFLRSQQPAFDSFVNNGYKLVASIEASNKINLTDAVISQIEKLAELKDKGIINADEFQSQKSRLLNS